MSRSVMWNLLGQVTPVGVALIAIPPLIQRLGTERFGILTLSWVLVGYFSVFDFGLGRALTQMVAARLEGIDANRMHALIWTALESMAVLGLMGGLTLLAFSGLIVHRFLKIPPNLNQEASLAFYCLAGLVPVVVTSAGLRGVLEAQQRFDLTNAVRIPLTALSYLGPLAMVGFTRSLVAMVMALAFSRVLGWAAYLLICLRVTPGFGWRMAFDGTQIRQLVRFGGWMTVSNLISPLMAYLDRFLIGGMISIGAVVYYATPYEIVTKLWVIPAALSGVLFPAVAAAAHRQSGRTDRIYGATARWTLLILFPATLLTATFAREALTVWLGGGFARQSAVVLQLLATGVFVNSLSYAPFALIQGVGRPDLTAKLHLMELPLYVVLLLGMLSFAGIQGAAVAWLVRVTLDAIALFWLAEGLRGRQSQLVQLRIAMVLALAAFSGSFLPLGLPGKAVFVSAVLFAFYGLSWAKLLPSDERLLVVDVLYKLRFL